MNDVVRALAQAVGSEGPREARGRAAVEIVRSARGYRWAAIYDVGDDEVALIADSGTTPPVHERVGIDKGLIGEAVRTRATVVGSEAVVPILGPESGIVIGTLDVESDRAGEFSYADLDFLEECAAALRPLYD